MRTAIIALILIATPAAAPALTILDSTNDMAAARENGQPYLRWPPSAITFRVDVDRSNMRARIPRLQTTWGLTPQGDYIAEDERTTVTIIPPSDPFDIERRIEKTEGWKSILTWGYENDYPEYGPVTGAEEWSPILDATGDAPYVTWPAVWAEMPATIESRDIIYVWQWEGSYDNRYVADVIDLGTTLWSQQPGLSAPLTMGITGTPRWPSWNVSFDVPRETSYLPDTPVEYTITDRWGESHALTRTHLESWLTRGEYAFLPIPEPSTIALVLIALVFCHSLGFRLAESAATR